MARAHDTGCDAHALLIVRLKSDRPVAGDLCWHPWQEARRGTPHGLPEDPGTPQEPEEPFKSLPDESDRAYFNAHVERLLFPGEKDAGARWICRPDELYLDLEPAKGSLRTTQVDLLERLYLSHDGGCAFGLIHLSLLPADTDDCPDTLWWARAISSTYRRKYEWFSYSLSDGERCVDLTDGRPVRALVTELFGDPDDALERSLYSVFVASCPEELVGDPAGQRRWRRALAKRLPRADLDTPNGTDIEREDRQTLRLAEAQALVLGEGAALTLERSIGTSYVRNLRSFWAESLLFGLLQQYSLEEFQRRLADFGDPLNTGVEQLRRDLLRFRNILWWSQLSNGSEIPQELLSRLRNEHGTERLFTDLEGDLATYSDYQHQDAEDRQARALRNVQTFGSGFLVAETFLTGVGVAGVSGCLLWVLLLAAVLLGVGVAVLVDWLLHEKPPFWPYLKDLARGGNGEGGIRTHEAG